MCWISKFVDNYHEHYGRLSYFAIIIPLLSACGEGEAPSASVTQSGTAAAVAVQERVSAAAASQVRETTPPSSTPNARLSLL